MADVSTASSPMWHRIARLKPRMRAHVKLHRHGFRNQVWYVLEDQVAGRYFRFTPEAYRVLNRMDGTRDVETLWHEVALESAREDDFSQDDLVRLLAQLHRAGVLHGNLLPDVEEIINRSEDMARKKRLMQFLNPLAVRVPLFDPERFIAATFPLIRPIFSVAGAVLIFAFIAYGAVLAAIHWQDLTGDLRDRLFNVQNVILLLLAYPFIKLVHELGHAYAVKRWGGELHELGVMMLVFMPVPYVDASAAAGFPSKWARATVGAAGIIVELVLAVGALLLWLDAEPGLLRAFLFNIMLIGGVSTLLFNGNPLLKFDGYYVLSDLIEIPNLGQRANRYWRYIVMNRLFGATSVTSPVTAEGEARWFALYAPAALIYRLVIMLAIIFFVAGQAFFIGIALAIWAVVLLYGLPLFKLIRALFTSPDLRGHRRRALGITGGVLGALVLILSLVPVPLATVAEGVVAPGARAPLVAGATGVVDNVAKPGAYPAGTAAVLLSDPFLTAREATLAADLRVIETRLRSASVTDPSEAAILREQQVRARAALERTREVRGNLQVPSTVPGELVVLARNDLIGQHVQQGALLGYSLDPAEFTIEVLVPEARIELFDAKLDAIAFRLISAPEAEHKATLLADAPSSVTRLPNPALATEGGGQILIDPGDPNRLRPLLPHFRLQIAPSEGLESHLIGQRVFVRFDHGYEPLAFQAYRTLRQIFLTRFNV